MSHPVPWLDYSEDLEETMTPEDIKKLPTPEWKNLIESRPGMWRDWKDEDFHKLSLLAFRFEQQRDALMMALEYFAKEYAIGQEAGEIFFWREFSSSEEVEAFRQAYLTLASIRQMKEGK